MIAAAAAGRLEAVAQLLRAGVDRDAVNAFGDTALLAAARAGHVNVCRALVAAGANSRVRNRERLTAADVARIRGLEAVASAIESAR